MAFMRADLADVLALSAFGKTISNGAIGVIEKCNVCLYDMALMNGLVSM